MTAQPASDLSAAPVRRRQGKAAQDMEIDAIVGTLTHRLVARLLHDQALGALTSPLEIARALVDTGAELVGVEPGLGSHRGRVRMRVITCAGQYLQRFQPAAPTTLLGTEMGVRDGVVDIAWEHPTLGVFFDEMKTTRHHAAVLSPAAEDQLTRYVRSGVARYGARFAGVRYIPLHHPAGALFAQPHGQGITTTPLAGTALDLVADGEVTR